VESKDMDPVQLFQVGVMHLNEGHLSEAQGAFRQIVQETPDNAPAWNNLGKAYLLDKKFLDAESAFQQAVKLIPSYADAHNNLGVVFMEQGDFEGAEKEFVLAQQDSTYRLSPMLWYNMGILARKRENPGKAVQYFTESLNRSERYFPSLIERGECYEELGRPALSVEDYRAAEEFSPSDVDLLFRFGRSLVKVGEYAEARKKLERVCVLAPIDPICDEATSILNTLP